MTLTLYNSYLSSLNRGTRGRGGLCWCQSGFLILNKKKKNKMKFSPRMGKNHQNHQWD